jgi:hypothetical protein
VKDAPDIDQHPQEIGRRLSLGTQKGVVLCLDI